MSGPTAHLKRKLRLLELIKCSGSPTHVRWHSIDIGTWESIHPRWWMDGRRIRFQFLHQGKVSNYWIESIQPKAWGVNLLLSSLGRPIAEMLEVSWKEGEGDSRSDASGLWDVVCQWLREKFPGYQIMNSAKRPDLSRTLSGLFLRVFFRYRAKDCLLVAVSENVIDEAPRAIGQALLWLDAVDSRHRLKSIPRIYLLVPSGCSALLTHRCRYLNKNRIRIEVWEYEMENEGIPRINPSEDPPAPEENKDYRWPVLGPFRWSSQLERVLNLAPNLIRRYPRFQDYDSLRLWGLEFAQVMGPDRDRICFGVGSARVELTENNFDQLRSLVQEILYFRRADSPDILHPYYRLQAERWLEALILEDIPHLFPEIVPESVYSQIPVYLGRNPGRIDILGADHLGTLVVMELKVTSDPDLPLQALDYWGRVVQHNNNGDFERRGYFSEILLNRRYPKIYIISPIFAFHDSTELLLRYLGPDVDIWKVSLNGDWRSEVKILRRIHCQFKDSN